MLHIVELDLSSTINSTSFVLISSISLYESTVSKKIFNMRRCFLTLRFREKSFTEILLKFDFRVIPQVNSGRNL